jgi:hypothetical protein
MGARRISSDNLKSGLVETAGSLEQPANSNEAIMPMRHSLKMEVFM